MLKAVYFYRLTDDTHSKQRIFPGASRQLSSDWNMSNRHFSPNVLLSLCRFLLTSAWWWRDTLSRSMKFSPLPCRRRPRWEINWCKPVVIFWTNAYWRPIDSSTRLDRQTRQLNDSIRKQIFSVRSARNRWLSKRKKFKSWRVRISFINGRHWSRWEISASFSSPFN